MVATVIQCTDKTAGYAGGIFASKSWAERRPLLEVEEVVGEGELAEVQAPLRIGRSMVTLLSCRVLKKVGCSCHSSRNLCLVF